MQSSRRRFLAQGGALTALGAISATTAFSSEEVLDLKWSDLAPTTDGVDIDALRLQGVVQHGQMSTPFDQETAGVLTDDYNGRLVRLPGFLVPLEFEGTGVKSALLVPYFGACVHVPPPPPNQLVFVTAAEAYESRGLFDPVNVVGEFNINLAETLLAEVGYSITAKTIEPYD